MILRSHCFGRSHGVVDDSEGVALVRILLLGLPALLQLQLSLRCDE